MEELDTMIKCAQCGIAMIRADLYEPGGTIPLCGGICEDGSWWICINPACDEGKENQGSEKDETQQL